MSSTLSQPHLLSFYKWVINDDSTLLSYWKPMKADIGTGQRYKGRGRFWIIRLWFHWILYLASVTCDQRLENAEYCTFLFIVLFVVSSDVKMCRVKTNKSSNDKLAVCTRSSRQGYSRNGQYWTRYHGSKNVSLFSIPSVGELRGD